MKKLLPYLQLVRLPNVFTAIADILMGYFVTIGVLKAPLALLVGASCCLYCAGMVLNDLMDFEEDARERPDRPLPSGKISQQTASRLGYGLLLLGILLAGLAGLTSALIAASLALAVYLYDGPLKRSIAAPWIMGSCRGLNALLGMSLASNLFQPDHLMIAGGLGLYVAGITWFARCEAKQSDPRLLQFGFATMAIGIVTLAMFPQFSERFLFLRDPILWPTLLVLLMTSVVRHCVIAIWTPDPRNVQAAVKHSLFTLILLDAAVVLALCGPERALIVLALIVPSVLLGRWLYST